MLPLSWSVKVISKDILYSRSLDMWPSELVKLKFQLLFFQTLSFSYVLATIASYYQTPIVIMTLATTTVVCIAIILFNLQQKVKPWSATKGAIPCLESCLEFSLPDIFWVIENSHVGLFIFSVKSIWKTFFISGIYCID